MRAAQSAESTMKIDGLNIVANEIRGARPGQKRFCARVQSLYVIDENGRRLIKHSFGDAWGRTRNEAILMVKNRVHAWVAEQAAAARGSKPGGETAAQ
jgi:hypothetical protein